jgi:ligand-binding sensor domain-containing protein/signal transduction histidine kinase/DNA-binding response OmpR family regulator
MHPFIKTFLTILTVAGLNFLNVAGQAFSFRKYQVNNGLSENSVQCILQDREGYMWFGTKDGLNRFDGFEYRIYKNNAADANSLGNNFIHSLFQAQDGKIWVGTDLNLYLFDPLLNQFQLFSKKTKNGIGVASAISTICEDNNHNIWIGTQYQGIFFYDIKSDQLTHYAAGASDRDIKSDIVWRIFKDASGTIWAGTRKGLSRFNDETKSFFTFDQQTTNGTMKDAEVLSIYEDSDGDLWVGTWSGGLGKLDKNNNTFTSYFTKETGMYATHIRALYEYEENKLLMGSDDGLYVLDKITHAQKRIDDPRNPLSLSDQNVYSIYKDREGGLWIGTYFGGVNYIASTHNAIEHYYPNYHPNSMSGKAVSQFCEDATGNLWIATEDGGLNYFDTQTRQFKVYLPTGNKNGLSYHNLHSLIIHRNKLWIGTFSRGIDVMDLSTHQFTNFEYSKTDNATIDDNCIFSLYETKDGIIYVGTPFGLSRYNEQSNTFTRITEVRDFVYDMQEDHLGNLWIASYSVGVYKFNIKTGSWKHYMHNPGDSTSLAFNKTTDVYIDNQQRLWFATEGNGICKYNYDKDNFTTINTNNGLPNNVTYGILDDKNGNLWVSSNRGISKINPATLEIKTYTREDGLQSNQFNYRSSYKARNGTFYFGGINGFNCFNPNDLTDNNYDPAVKITNIEMLHSDENSIPDSTLLKLTNTTHHITLPHNQSSLRISFVSLSFQAPEKNEFAYILENQDSNWTPLGNQRNVTYINLPPGDYTFRIKGTNNNAKWSSNTDYLTITILPPWWKSNIAIFLYFLIIGAIAYYLYRLNHKRYRIKQKHKLEEYRLEKEKEMYHTKIDFFTNIAHEIRTPVSLIKAPLDCIIHSGDGSSETKDNLAVIMRNTDRLLDLINQLLDFRKIEENLYRFKFQQININQLMADIYYRFNSAAIDNKIQLTFTPPEAPIIANIDKESLTKILSNLMSNALKHAMSSINMEASINSDNETFRISITDDGKGIEDDMKAKVFEPFFQIESTDYNANKVGTGIGLALTKQLVDRHNGTITIEDSETSGCIFIVEIPLNLNGESNTEDATNLQEEQVPERVKQSMTKAGDAKPNLLVVEDNQELRNFLEKNLKQEFHIYTAPDGAAALQCMEENNFDLIISDILMPVMDGIELVKNIRQDEQFCHIPIILLSAKTNIESKIEGLDYGADSYIEKPFSIEFLKAQASSLIKNRIIVLEKFANSPFISYGAIANNKKDEEFIQKINDEIERNLADTDFSIEKLAFTLSMSRSKLQRKIKGISGMAPNDYIRVYRLKKAATLLSQGEYRINEICFIVGFNSPSYFAKCFLKQFGALPKEYLKSNDHSQN